LRKEDSKLIKWIRYCVRKMYGLIRPTTDLAQARGAIPVIVVPQFSPEEPAERMLRRRILDDAGLQYDWVELDPSWHVPGDAHPDARAAHKIAVAVATRLRER
jgi:hypothetical protein